jgi:hypothetical protein
MFVSFRMARSFSKNFIRPGSAHTVQASPPIPPLTDRDPQVDPGRAVDLRGERFT